MEIIKNKKRKVSFATAIILGVIMLATSVYAEIAMKSGYEQLKDSIKKTAKGTSIDFDSYTLTSVTSIKDNGLLVGLINHTEKNSGKNSVRKRETSTIVTNPDEIISMDYNYYDNEVSIWYDSYRDTYTVSRIAKPGGDKEKVAIPEYSAPVVEDPFESQVSRDIERVIDAVVGNLKDNVNVDTNPNGAKVIYGSLTEVQIPPLVNAVMSLIFKQAQPGNRYYSERTVAYPTSTEVPVVGDGEAVLIKEQEVKRWRYRGIGPISSSVLIKEQEVKPRPEMNIPVMVNDLYIKNVSGRAEINENGVITAFKVSGTISGMDKNGVSHDLEMEMDVKIEGINSTNLTPPDLTGKKVEEFTYDDKISPKYTISERHIGKYVRDIVLLKDNKYVKVGESTIEITLVDDKTVSGVIKNNYTDSSAGNNEEIPFSAKNDNYSTSISFTYTNAEGNTMNAHIIFDVERPTLFFSAYELSNQGGGSKRVYLEEKYDMVFN